MIEKTRLKPCPFCGGEAKVETSDLYIESDEMLRYWIECKDCKASVVWETDVIEVINAWNIRTNRDIIEKE